jgi:hypothetical protein
MNWQLIAVIVIVSAASLYLARQTWSAFIGRKGGCASGCGCSTKATPTNGDSSLIAPQEITLRRSDPRLL